MSTLQRRNRPNGHSHEGDLTAGEAQCPYCGQSISRKEFKEIQARMVAEEAARSAKREQAIRDGFAREKAQAEMAKKAEIEKARREAAKVAETKLRLIRQNQEATIAARLDAERERAAKKQAEAVNAEKLQHAAEKLRLETALADMQRKLAAKPAHQIGEPAEVDLFDALVAAFPTDRISRVVKGQKGADIIVEVVHGGEVVGKICLDSKAHARWSSKFTSKLRSDQLAEGAAFAVLSASASAFPAGERELAIRDQVVIATPQRVPVLVHLLRRQIVDNFVQKLGSVARDEKAAQMYAFILSPVCDDLFDKLLKLIKEAQALDQNDAKNHRAVWDKRAELFVGILAVREQFVGVVADIVGGGR